MLRLQAAPRADVGMGPNRAWPQDVLMDKSCSTRGGGGLLKHLCGLSWGVSSPGLHTPSASSSQPSSAQQPLQNCPCRPLPPETPLSVCVCVCVCVGGGGGGGGGGQCDSIPTPPTSNIAAYCCVSLRTEKGRQHREEVMTPAELVCTYAQSQLVDPTPDLRYLPSAAPAYQCSAVCLKPRASRRGRSLLSAALLWAHPPHLCHLMLQDSFH